MSVFRYREDRIPALLFFTYFIVDVLIFFYATSIPFLVAWLLIGIPPKAFISAWNHHHQHVPFFKHTALNRLLELIFAFQTGITTNGWVLHHVLGHHQNYLDQRLDESRWKDLYGRTMGTIEYSFWTAVTGYPRAFQVGKKCPKHQNPFIWMTLLVFSLLCGALYHNWVNGLFVFVVPMAISLYMTAWHTYYHHSGLDTDEPFEACYNITEKWYNIFTGNLGYHTAHHDRMGLHWSKLPEHHQTIVAEIPARLFRNPPPPFKWLHGVSTGAAYP